MDLKFNFKSVPIDEFIDKRQYLIIDLAKWITPIMNRVHSLEYSYLFWLRILRNHLKISVNKKHYFETGNCSIKRYLVDVNAFGKVDERNAIYTQLEYLSKQFLKSGSFNGFFNGVIDNNSICLGIRGNELAQDNKGTFIKEHFPFLWLPSFKTRRKWKAEVSKIEDNFLKAVLKSLPYVYVELFHHYLSERLVQIPFLEQKEFHAEHIGSILSQVTIAHCFEKGARFYLYQAGCGNGERDNWPDEPEYETCSSYITYGWKRHIKDVPGKAYRLETFKSQYQSLLKNHASKSYDILFVLSISNPEMRKHYNHFLDKFIQDIDRKKYARFLLRPRPRSKYIPLTKEVKYMDLPDFVDIDEGRGRDSMVKSVVNTKLSIIVYTPATHLYECAVTKHPFMAVDMFEYPSKLFRPHLDFFREVGILHKNVSSMIKKLNEIELEEWWSNVLKDNRFDDFTNQFASLNND